MESILPQDVINRPKVGFGAPIRFWLSEHLRPLVDDVLSAESLRRRGIFHPQGVRRLIEQDRTGSIDGAYLILSILCIELWFRIFLDRSVHPQQTCL
jgi:asparagine synthase (glutamine-hydrolysing)